MGHGSVIYTYMDLLLSDLNILFVYVFSSMMNILRYTEYKKLYFTYMNEMCDAKTLGLARFTDCLLIAYWMSSRVQNMPEIIK